MPADVEFVPSMTVTNSSVTRVQSGQDLGSMATAESPSITRTETEYTRISSDDRL